VRRRCEPGRSSMAVVGEEVGTRSTRWSQTRSIGPGRSVGDPSKYLNVSNCKIDKFILLFSKIVHLFSLSNLYF
jgi:hypothetical protein